MQESSRVIITGDMGMAVRDKVYDGTQRSGWWLDLVVLKVFSSYMIL